MVVAEVQVHLLLPGHNSRRIRISVSTTTVAAAVVLVGDWRHDQIRGICWCSAARKRDLNRGKVRRAEYVEWYAEWIQD